MRSRPTPSKPRPPEPEAALSRYLADPLTPAAARLVADSLRTWAVRAVTADAQAEAGRHGNQLDLDDDGVQKRLAARAEALAISRAGDLFEAADNVLRLLVVEAHQSGLHRYHDNEYEDAMALVLDALEGKNRQASDYYELRHLAVTVIPYMQQHGLPGAEAICAPGAKAKSRTAATYLNGVLTDPRLTEGEKAAAVERVLADVADRGVSSRAMDERYRAHSYAPPAVAPVPAWHYLEADDQGFLLLRYDDAAQWRVICAGLKGVLDLRLGTGQEPALDLITQRLDPQTRRLSVDKRGQALLRLVADLAENGLGFATRPALDLPADPARALAVAVETLYKQLELADASLRQQARLALRGAASDP